MEFETVKPPQTHLTRESPNFGMADSRLVITVAPQYDICPHGSTYPKKAVAIRESRSLVPEVHTIERK